MSTTRKPKKDLTKPYEPTPRERGAKEAYLARQEKAPALRVKVSKKRGKQEVTFDHPDIGVGRYLFMEALGATELDFVADFVGQLINAGSKGEDIDEHAVNFMLAVVKGVEPKDQMEAMLAAQMAAVHMATMTFARRLATVETIDQQDSAERAFNKLTRTFATQMDALKRYRTGGEQKVRVEHVTVNEGGQAIVGNVTHRGRGTQKKSETTS